MSCHQHGYPWPSLTTPPYRPLLPAGLQGYIPHRHRAAVYRFELVILPLLIHVKGSTGVHPLWACPYFSSSIPHVWFKYSQLNIKIVLFQTFQFSISMQFKCQNSSSTVSISKKHFYFKQFSLTNKTVLFQAIQFSVSTQFNSTWHIDRTQMLPLQIRVDLGAVAMKRYPTSPTALALLVPHHQIV